MKFDDDDLKDGKLWAALQKEIDRDLAEDENGETLQEELEDIEDSIEIENKSEETKSEYRIPNETADLSSLRSALEATERAKDEEIQKKKSRTNVESEQQNMEIPELEEEEEEPEEGSIPEQKKTSHVSQTTEKLEGLIDFDDDPEEKKAEKEPEEVTVDDDLILNDPFTDADDLLENEKTAKEGAEKEQLGDRVEAAMERLVNDTVGHIPMPESYDDEDDDYDDEEDDDEEEYVPHGAKPQKKKGKGGAAAAVAAVAVLAVGGFLYGSRMFHYQKYFFNGTTLNGVDCSGMTAKEAEIKIKEQAADYTLNVKFKNGDTKSVSGKDIDYTYAGDGSVENTLKKQNSFLWFLGNGGKEKASQVNMQYSQEKLDDVINGFEEFKSADGENASASAYITFQNNEFEIMDAVMGEGMDLTLAKQCIENALTNADTEVDLEKAGVYDGTQVTADDKTLNAQKDQLNELVRASITYNMPDGTTQVLDGNTMKDWLITDADGNYSKDENQWNEKVKEYVANLAAGIDTDGKDHTFPATGIEGGVVVKQEGYGWKVDQEKEAAKIAEEVDAHAADTREPEYAQKEFAVSTENNGFGKTYVEVDASRQHIWFYKDGNLVVEGDCVTGLMEKSSYTKPGIYTSAAKESQKKLHGELQADGSYSWERDVDSWIPFNGEIGFYDASWRSSFGGNLYQTAGSTTGSVALPTAVAQTLYENIDDGTPVIVYYSEAYEVSEDSLTVTQEPEADDTKADDAKVTATPAPTRTPSYTYDDDDDDYNDTPSRPSTPSTSAPTRTPSTPAPTQTPSTPAPTEAPSTPEPTVAPSTPEPTQEPSAPDQGDHSNDDDYPGKGEN